MTKVETGTAQAAPVLQEWSPATDDDRPNSMERENELKNCDICEDNKDQMKLLKRAYGRRTAGQRCWSEEYL